MRLDTKDTPLFLADNALISGGCSNNNSAKKCKEQVGLLIVQFLLTILFLKHSANVSICTDNRDVL